MTVYGVSRINWFHRICNWRKYFRSSCDFTKKLSNAVQFFISKILREINFGEFCVIFATLDKWQFRIPICNLIKIDFTKNLKVQTWSLIFCDYQDFTWNQLLGISKTAKITIFGCNNFPKLISRKIPQLSIFLYVPIWFHVIFRIFLYQFEPLMMVQVVTQCMHIFKGSS